MWGQVARVVLNIGIRYLYCKYQSGSQGQCCCLLVSELKLCGTHLDSQPCIASPKDRFYIIMWETWLGIGSLYTRSWLKMLGKKYRPGPLLGI